MREIVLHGRGGQGVVFASELLVAAFVLDGRYGNSIPYFGFERRGAPVAAFVRFDDKPIREKTQIYHPDCIVVLDPTIKRAVDIFKGLKDDGIAVLNDPRPPEAIELPACVKRVGVVDATRISLEILNAPITNSCMIGAFMQTTGWLNWEAVEGAFRQNFPERLVEANLKAAKEAYETTRVLERG